MPTVPGLKPAPKFVRDAVLRTIDPILDDRADGDGVCSSKTRSERRQFYLLMFAQLWQLEFRVRKPENLHGKHVIALMQLWHQQGICAGTLRTRHSMIRYLCKRMGKAELVKPITEYVPEEAIQRKTACETPKTWEAQGVNPLEIIDLAKQINERLAVMLAMQHFFGLRVKESIEMRPGKAVVEEGLVLEVREGTKGGLTRRVPIRTDDQQDVIGWARRVAASGKTGRLRWTDCTWEQAQTRFYHLIRYRLGISKALKGISPHGLRHGYANRRYRDESGHPSPIEGGALGKIDRQTHHDSSITVSNELGLRRVDVTTSYCGTYGHGLRGAKKNKETLTFYPLPTLKLPV